MHNAAYEALGIAFTYVPFRVTDLPSAMSGMRALGIRGFGISMPYKQAIMPLLDEIDPEARNIGAVNTVVNADGRLTGYNTDGVGALRALREVDLPTRPRILLLGAGGAARAVAHGLLALQPDLCIANRTVEKAREIAAQIGARFAATNESERASEYDVVINASSVGMGDVASGSPVSKSVFRKGLVVMDIVYKPIHTDLLRDAADAGATIIHGGRMLLHQAARQFELYTGRDAPLDVMDRALRSQIAFDIPN